MCDGMTCLSGMNFGMGPNHLFVRLKQTNTAGLNSPWFSMLATQMKLLMNWRRITRNMLLFEAQRYGLVTREPEADVQMAKSEGSSMSTYRTEPGVGSVAMTNTGVSSIRSRDAVLEMLVPKLLGIVWTSGKFAEPEPIAKCAPDLLIGAARFCEDAIDLSVWDPSTKLLSLHPPRQGYG